MYSAAIATKIAEKLRNKAEDAVTALTTSPYIIESLKRLNPFILIDKNGNTKNLRDEDVEALIRYILDAHIMDILNDFATSSPKKAETLLAITNAYLNKYLNKIEADGRIKRILNPLKDESYKEKNPNCLLYTSPSPRDS